MALHPEDRLSGISLCAGAGGLDLGLAVALPGYRTVCYVERDSFAAATLVARMEDKALDQAPIWSDVKTFDGTSWRGKVDILSAGYPCQPFTFSGHRRGSNDSRHLWPSVARIIRECRPRLVFCENVEGHLSLGFPQVARDLQEMGFGIRAGLFAAAEVGAAHQRRRLFILAYALGPDERQQIRSSRRRERIAVRTISSPDRPTDSVAGDCEVLDRVLDADAILGDAGGYTLTGLPLFAPAPCDLVAWQQTLARHPELQPCLYGLDHGVAHRMERSSLAGNGVCPLAAALAFRTLTAGL